MLVLLAISLPAAERKPNLIFILADDLGYGELGCYGQKLIQTPNLDRMAAEGMTVVASTSAEFVEFLARETAKYNRIIKSAGIQNSQ